MTSRYAEAATHRWFHRQFAALAAERYAQPGSATAQRHRDVADFFGGAWSCTPKPYGSEGAAAIRHVQSQPTSWETDDHGRKYNRHKLEELWYQLVRAGAWQQLLDDCLLNAPYLDGLGTLGALGTFTVELTSLLAGHLGDATGASLPQEHTDAVRSVKQLIELISNAVAHDGVTFASQVFLHIDSRCTNPVFASIREQCQALACLQATSTVSAPGHALLKSFTQHAQRVTCARFLPNRTDQFLSGSRYGWPFTNTQSLIALMLVIGAYSCGA